MIAGKNVATINDKNNNDWVTKGAKILLALTHLLITF
jgi:hypothetical protein